MNRLNFKSVGSVNGFQCSLPPEVTNPTHEDIRLLEDEIFELQEYSAKVEQDISRLKTDAHHLQNQTRLIEKVRTPFNDLTF